MGMRCPRRALGCRRVRALGRCSRTNELGRARVKIADRKIDRDTLHGWHCHRLHPYYAIVDVCMQCGVPSVAGWTEELYLEIVRTNYELLSAERDLDGPVARKAVNLPYPHVNLAEISHT